MATVTDLKIDGLGDGATIVSSTPTISWVYNGISDQTIYTVIVSKDENLINDILWQYEQQHAIADGTVDSIIYNIDSNGQALTHHEELHVGVKVKDASAYGIYEKIQFELKEAPKISLLTVDSKINPTNVANSTPTFGWKYTDFDTDPIKKYRIRVGTSNSNLGSDLFNGNKWNSGTIISEDSFSAVYNFNEIGTSLDAGIKYYFQIQIEDEYQASDWATGIFQLNAIPVVTSVVLNPVLGTDPDYIGYCNNDLSVSYVYTDDEPESSKTEIKWSYLPLNGSWTPIASLNNLKTVLAGRGLFFPGDKWKCSVRPHDGIAFGALVSSNEITFENRISIISSAIVLPGFPKTSNYLEAKVETYDPDGDVVSVSIKWFKNGEEVKDLRNSRRVPPFYTIAGDKWNFEATPNDGYDPGDSVFSNFVEILGTKPSIISFLVDGYKAPAKLKNKSPNFSWVYKDDDLKDQVKYQFIIGNRQIKTSGRQKSCSYDISNGILKTVSSDGEILEGNEIYDSGVISSSSNNITYSTQGSTPKVKLLVDDFTNLRNYAVDYQASFVYLKPGSSDGTASLVFGGESALYNISLEYEKDLVPSSYNVSINGDLVGSFSSDIGSGIGTHLFQAMKIKNGDLISVLGIATLGSKAKFKSVLLSPVLQYEIDVFDSLSGYIQDDNGIRLSTVIGTAIYAFPYYSGLYDIEVVYETELVSGQTLGVFVNDVEIDTIAYSEDNKIKSQIFQNIEINKGDEFKLIGNREVSSIITGGLVRVRQVLFRPKSTVATAGLKSGNKYYASVKVFNGTYWSNWHETVFSVFGSAWDVVSNETGWTIEARVSVN